MSNMYSIIIPFQTENSYLDETLENLVKLKGNFEVILLPDDGLTDNYMKKIEGHRSHYSIQVKSSGKVSPSIKRDMGAEISAGNILAFIDDDAYPDKNWLINSDKYFEDEKVAAIGGAQVTPEDDTFWQKVSGAVFLSPLNGNIKDRYIPGSKSYEVDDWPSVNLLVRKSDFLAIDGFDSNWWPGEDTKLCYDLVYKIHKKILYAPDIIVYHHRREGFKRHMRQVGNYGLHRGHFARLYPESSFRPIYLIPSCFFVFCIITISASWLPDFFIPLISLGWILYLSALIYSTLKLSGLLKSFSIAAMTIPYIVSTHVVYGFRFIDGYIFRKDLKSSLGR